MSAFSLQGPLASWMTPADLPEYPDDRGGGPMNLHEFYRWNSPVITYAYDSTFLNYFGSNGVAAIEQAIKIINDLPPASEIDVNQYPTYTTRVNYRASALLLTDVKSMALHAILQNLGCASPESYTWTMRKLTHDSSGTIPYFNVIKRNFDPISNEESSFVNGVLYTYYIDYTPPAVGETAIAREVLVDPLGRYYTTVASGNGLYRGHYYTGLTRDDVGCIKYIYRKTQTAIENVLNVSAVTGLTYISGGSSSGWVIPVIGTNSTDIGSVDSTALVGTANGWYALNITNSTSTNTDSTTTVDTTTTNSYVDLALRGGVDKFNFVRMELDSFFGIFKPVTNLYTDTYYTNYVKVRQVLQRSITSPDFVFKAGDLGMSDVPEVPINFLYLYNEDLNESANNTIPTQVPGTGGELNGPGIIQPVHEIWFSKLGSHYFNGLSYLTEANAEYWGVFMWGSFDGSTNAPIVYPSGKSIKDLESQLFGN